MRLLLVHGFTQTPRSWDPVIACLNADRHDRSDTAADADETIALDVAQGTSFLDTADALGASGGSGVYVGYSMGGRLCLQLALRAPTIVAGLVLISATAGLETDEARVARRAADHDLCVSIERDGVDVFLSHWLNQPMFASLQIADADLDARRRRSSASLVNDLTLLGTGQQPSLWNQLDQLSMPVLVIAGSLDMKFVTIARRLVEQIPTATLRIIDGAGHAAHLERPEITSRLIASWAHEHCS